LHLTKRSPGLLDALVREMMLAREGSEPLKNLAEQEWSDIKVDVIGDSPLIMHVGASTPGARIVGGKIEKPPGWEPTVAELHIGMKRMMGKLLAGRRSRRRRHMRWPRQALRRTFPATLC